MSALAKPEMDKFKSDYLFVFRSWLKYGQISRHEYQQQRRDADQAVQKHLHDRDWMQCAAAHFRQMAQQIERDRERSQRIAAEVRAERLMEAA